MEGPRTVNTKAPNMAAGGLATIRPPARVTYVKWSAVCSTKAPR